MIEWIREKFEIKELMKFLAGGGSAVAVDAALYALLKQRIGLSPAKAVSYVSGAAVGFIINKFWTFESKKFRGSEVFRYAALYMASAYVNTAVNGIVLWMVPNVVAAFLCATGTSTVMNFLGQKFIVFRDGNEVED